MERTTPLDQRRLNAEQTSTTINVPLWVIIGNELDQNQKEKKRENATAVHLNLETRNTLK